jgi:tRNA (mo5U34)-methyltransferase
VLTAASTAAPIPTAASTWSCSLIVVSRVDRRGREPAVALKPEGDGLERARRALEENPRLWYHTIELAPGMTTPGFIDLRPAARKLLPPDLSGRRALDVGTFDGFWAFEMERRGADVVAIDLARIELAEFPPPARERAERRAGEEGFELGVGFRLAAEALGSRVDRRACDVYELTPDAIGGAVDLAFNGATLTHLRDPVRALERIRDALRPRGELICFEPFSVALTLRSPRRPSADFRAHVTDYTWWLPNLACLAAWLVAAGFVDVRRVALARPPSARPAPYAGFVARRP